MNSPRRANEGFQNRRRAKQRRCTDTAVISNARVGQLKEAPAFENRSIASVVQRMKGSVRLRVAGFDYGSDEDTSLPERGAGLRIAQG